MEDLVTAVMVVVAVAGIALCFAQILAPIRPRSSRRRAGRHAGLDRNDQPLWDSDDPPSRPERARSWWTWWRNCPRPPLTFRDWIPRSGFLFFPSLLGAGLAFGGITVLVTPDQTFRLGGLLALLTSIPVLTLIIAYVRRPVDATATPVTRW